MYYMNSEELAKLLKKRRPYIIRMIESCEEQLKQLGPLDYYYTNDGRSINGEAKRVFNLTKAQCNLIIISFQNRYKSPHLGDLKFKIAQSSMAELK